MELTEPQRRTLEQLIGSERPVFAADRVRWSDVGAVPDDLVGADAMRGR